MEVVAEFIAGRLKDDLRSVDVGHGLHERGHLLEQRNPECGLGGMQ
jgi:hypothetical protein